MITHNAIDGLDGLEKLKARYYKCVFMDINMPRLDGIECVQMFREWENVNRPSKQKIFGLSANNVELDIKEACLNAGMDRYFEKPLKEGYIKQLAQSAPNT